MSVLHGSFTVARELNAPLPRVWDAYSVERSRAAWRRIPGPDSVLSLDFRVGGWERLTGSSTATGTPEVIASQAIFLDIAPQERIVAAHEVRLDGVRRWVSLISIAFEPAGDGTRVAHTEQYTFLTWAGDGAHETAHLRGSTQLAFNALAAIVEPAN
ncbi:MAG: SRPBCC domain-containing protein [Trebonia sp.]|jgi:uncharacterized protein YndB with AHSA1/START domain